MTPVRGRRLVRVLAGSAALPVLLGLAWPGPAAAAKSGGASLLPGANSKEPVNIDAGKLDYFDKEQKLVYTGDVVAVQGETTLKASVLTIFLQKSAPDQAPGAPAPPPSAGPAPGAGSSVKHMEAAGPVTMISKDQIGTGDHATYDKAENKIYLIGNVTLSQGTNITQGDRLVYDLNTTRAQVFSGSTTSRVKSVFTPGSSSPASPGTDAAAPDAAKKEKPGRRKPAGKAATASEQPVAQ